MHAGSGVGTGDAFETAGSLPSRPSHPRRRPIFARDWRGRTEGVGEGVIASEGAQDLTPPPLRI